MWFHRCPSLQSIETIRKMHGSETEHRRLQPNHHHHLHHHHHHHHRHLQHHPSQPLGLSGVNSYSKLPLSHCSCGSTQMKWTCGDVCHQCSRPFCQNMYLDVIVISILSHEVMPDLYRPNGELLIDLTLLQVSHVRHNTIQLCATYLQQIHEHFKNISSLGIVQGSNERRCSQGWPALCWHS